MKTLGMLLNEAFANDKQMKAAIYKLLKPELSKRFKDEDWTGLQGIWDKLKKNRYTIDVSAPNGGYKVFRDKEKAKEFKITISKDMRTLHGVMVCHAAGTVENPFAEYDVTLTF